MGRWGLLLLALSIGAFACTPGGRPPARVSTPTLPAEAPPRLVAQEVASGLRFPSSFALAPDGRVFTTERVEGAIRVLTDWQTLEEPFATLTVARRAETGLLGLALHPQFPGVPYVYLYYTYQAGDQIFNRLSRLRGQGSKGVDEEVLLDRIPAATFHNGGALAFGPDGMLYITTGDATENGLAQDLDSLAGKVLRLNDDGTVPGDNPFQGSPVYTLGHRNSFGIALHPTTGHAYMTENGTSRDDEVNRLIPGANYGWPLRLGVSQAPGFQDPILTFTPQIAPTQAIFYTGDKLPPQYHGNLFFGDWNTGSLRRIALDSEGRVREHEVVLRTSGEGILGGILDVEQGPDGYLYFSTATALYRVVVQP